MMMAVAASPDRTNLVAVLNPPRDEWDAGWVQDMSSLQFREQVVACCPPGYWRLGNVQVVCARFGVPLFDTLAELVAAVRSKLANGAT